MRDFQNFLRLVVEAEGDLPGAEGAEGAEGAVTTIEEANTPTQAFMAYRREANKLMSELEYALTQADKQLAAMGGHTAAFKDTVKTKDQLAAHLGQFQTATPRPTIDRSKIAAMVGKYKGSAPPPATPGT